MMVVVYAVLIFLVLRFSVTLFNFLSNPKLGYYGKHFADKVSIIVLSAHSQPGLESLLASIDEQEYRYIEMIVQQDESIAELTARATGEYFLFITPCTTLHYGLLNNLIYRAKVFNLAVLSLIPTYKVSGFLAQCTYPLNDFLLLNLLPLRLVRLSNVPTFAAGSNDCLFFNAEQYGILTCNEKQSDKLPPAMELVKLAKQQQFKAEVLLANKMMQNNIVDLDTRSFAQGLLLTFSNNSIAAFIYIGLVVLGPLIVLMNFDPAFLILPFGLVFMSRVMIAFMTAQSPVRNVLLHPLQMVFLFVLMIRAIVAHIQRSFKLKK
jgi:hypothetical protein